MSGPVLITLRLIHILSGVFWIGSAFVMAAFIEPTIRATAPESQKVMGHLSGPRRFPLWISVAAVLATLSGVILYWGDSEGFRSVGWMSSATGVTFTIGGISGLAAFVIGFVMAKPAGDGIAALARQIQAGGKPPTPEQLGVMAALQNQLALSGRLTSILLIIALIAMAVAQPLAQLVF